jgi:NAD(P)-dependent dehydrogenase (short-subunit alcohol dehydrogenase family)
MGELEGKVAIVTGAADGIGAATAAMFAEHGAEVVRVDRRAEPGFVVADVTDEESVAQLVAEAVARHGRIDALVNVVGGSRPGKTAIDLTLAEWNELLALNLTSTFLMSRAVLPHMEAAGGGTIVNVSSGAGLRGMKANPGYIAAKAGVSALTRALAIDHGPKGVRVNAVAPGPIRTPLMDRNRSPEEIAAMGGLAIMGRIGNPDEIASAILWLSSDGSSYLMGQTLEVDGGPSPAI